MKKYNDNTPPLVSLLASHPTIATVHHPSIEPTLHLFKSIMPKYGGLGNLLGVIFHNPSSAELFYNILDICKGLSPGTNFTLTVPYVQLANFWNQDKVAKYGVPRHIIRISVCLEDREKLAEVFLGLLRVWWSLRRGLKRRLRGCCVRRGMHLRGQGVKNSTNLASLPINGR